MTSAPHGGRQPGPDHPITVESNPARVTVRVGDRVLLETDHGLVLREASYPAVHYLPREDADLSMLVLTEHTTHCPFKGDAEYYSVEGPDGTLKNAVWSYPEPFEAVAEIEGHLAFYADKVSITEG